MKKQECVNLLEKVKRSYSREVASVEYFEAKNFSGYKPEKLNSKKSLVGKWIYEDIEDAKNIMGSIFYEELESLHSQWCDEYNKISELYLQNTKKGFLFSKKLDPMSKDKAKAYLDDLVHTTEKLTVILSKVLIRTHALPEGKFS